MRPDERPNSRTFAAVRGSMPTSVMMLTGLPEGMPTERRSIGVAAATPGTCATSSAMPGSNVPPLVLVTLMSTCPAEENSMRLNTSMSDGIMPLSPKMSATPKHDCKCRQDGAPGATAQVAPCECRGHVHSRPAFSIAARAASMPSPARHRAVVDDLAVAHEHDAGRRARRYARRG